MLKLIVIGFTLTLASESFAQTKVATLFKKADNYSRFAEDIASAINFSWKNSKDSKRIEIKNFYHDGSVEDISEKIAKIRKDKIDILVGGETSQYAMIIAPKFKDKVFITPTASSSLLGQVHPAPIRMIHSDEQYAKMALFAAGRSKAKTVGVFWNTSYPNTDLISKLIEKELSSKFKVVVYKHVNGQDITESTLKDFIAQKVDTVMLFSYENDLRKVYSALKSKNINPTFIGADGWGRDEFLLNNLLSKPANKDFKGLRSLYWNSNRKDQYFRSEISKMEKHFNRPVDAFFAIGHDTFSLISQTLAASPKIENFNSTVLKTKYTYLLTTQELTYSKNYLPQKDFYLFELSGRGINFFGEFNEQR